MTELARQVIVTAGTWCAKRGDLLDFVTSIVAKHQKNEGGSFGEKNVRKKSHNAEKIERGDPLGLFNIHFVAKHQKIEGGTFWEIFFSKKVSQCRNKLKGGTLWDF